MERASDSREGAIFLFSEGHEAVFEQAAEALFFVVVVVVVVVVVNWGRVALQDCVSFLCTAK